MSDLNSVNVTGRLTRDVELRTTKSGTSVTEIGLAVSDRIKQGGEWVESTVFCEVTLWGRTAEIANDYLSKGSRVGISGKLKFDTWEKDGQKRSKLTVTCDNLSMLDSKSGGGEKSSREPEPGNEHIPF